MYGDTVTCGHLGHRGKQVENVLLFARRSPIGVWGVMDVGGWVWPSWLVGGWAWKGRVGEWVIERCGGVGPRRVCSCSGSCRSWGSWVCVCVVLGGGGVWEAKPGKNAVHKPINMQKQWFHFETVCWRNNFYWRLLVVACTIANITA